MCGMRNPTPKRTGAICLECELCLFDTGSPDFSEDTPGESASITCRKGVFVGGCLYDLDVSFVDLIRTAEVCPHYIPDGGL